MGKSSSSKFPSFSAGTISVNGNSKAKTYKKGNNVVSNYTMSDAEKQAYEYAQKTFADNLPYVNIFDKDTQNNLQAELDAYTLNGQKLVENIYTPMLNNLKNDIASRFGNFDNSVFMDNLNSIETNRVQSINNLAQDVMSKRSELINNELSQRYNYLNFLQDIQNQTNSNMLNFINASQQNSNIGNNYNTQAFNAQQSSKSAWDNYSKLTSGLLSTAGPYGQTGAIALQIANKYL